MIKEIEIIYYAKNGDDFHAERAIFTPWSSGVIGSTLNIIHGVESFDNDTYYYRSSMTTLFVDISSYTDGHIEGIFSDPITGLSQPLLYPVMLDCDELNTFDYNNLNLIDGTELITEEAYNALVSTHNTTLDNSVQNMLEN